MIRLGVCVLSVFFLTACIGHRLVTVTKVRAIEPTPVIAETPQPPGSIEKTLKAIGYGVESDYLNYPAPRKRLLAIRAAKLDAYRSLAETLYGTRITGMTTVKDAAIESDRFRAYIDAVVRGAQLLALTPKGEGIYEAELELKLTNNVYSCFRSFTSACIGQTKAYEVHTEVHVGNSCNPCAATTPITNRCLDGCNAVTPPQVIYYK